MERMPAEWFLRVAVGLFRANNYAATADNPDEALSAKDSQDFGFTLFNGLLVECKNLGLPASYASASKIVHGLRGGRLTYRELGTLTVELLGRFHDELRAQVFLYLPPKGSELYGEPLAGWKEVVQKFPSIQAEIEESAKCLALERGTASVFHQMRVMESGLKAVAGRLGIAYSPSWESYLRQIDDRIKLKHKKKGIQWKRDERFFAEVASHLGIVRVAWRNPTMHIERAYTIEEAGEVFGATRAFMRLLSSRLSEKPPLKRTKLKR